MRAIATVNLGNRKPKVSTFLKAKHPDITPCEILQIQYKINHRRLKECPTAFEYSITPETVEHYYNLIRKGQQMPSNTANSIISTLENTKPNKPLYIHQENPISNVTTKTRIRNYLAKHNLTKEQQNTIIGRLYDFRHNHDLTDKVLTIQELAFLDKQIGIEQQTRPVKFSSLKIGELFLHNKEIYKKETDECAIQMSNLGTYHTSAKVSTINHNQEVRPVEIKIGHTHKYQLIADSDLKIEKSPQPQQKNGNTINIRVKHKSLPTLTGVITLPNQVTVKWDIPQLNSDTPIDLNELEIMI